MPQLKSVQTLQEMCWQASVQHLKELEEQSEYLPPIFRNELLDRCCKNLPIVKNENIGRKLPTKLFINQSTLELLDLQYFDAPEDEVVRKIQNNCRRLKKVKLRFDFLQITYNNPQLVHLDISQSNVRNNDLSTIAKNSPQLKHLDLKLCQNITDNGIQHLPPNITHLTLSGTRVTPTGCIAALNSLKSMKELKHTSWCAILQLLSKENLGKTYQIEKLKCNIENPPYFNFSKTASNFFPKLRIVDISFFHNFAPLDTPFTNGRFSNLTCASLFDFPANTIEVIGHHCPLLEDLKVIFTNQYFARTPLPTTAHVPFKHLRKLYIDVGNVDFRGRDFLKMMKNCKRLEELGITDYNQFENELIVDMIRVNPLNRLRLVSFSNCNYITIESIVLILKSVRSVKDLNILFCEKIWRCELDCLRKVIERYNWDISLTTNFSIVKALGGSQGQPTKQKPRSKNDVKHVAQSGVKRAAAVESTSPRIKRQKKSNIRIEQKIACNILNDNSTSTFNVASFPAKQLAIRL